MAKIGIGIDCGADSLKVVAGCEKGGSFQILEAAAVDVAAADPLGELSGILSGWGVKGEAVLGVTGRDMIIRYTQIPPMPDWRLNQVMGFEIADLAMQAGGDLSADFNRLDIPSSISDDETILLTLIKNSLIQERSDALEGCKVSVGAFTPNAIALFNLMVKAGEADSGTVMAVNIGAEAMDVAIAQDGTLIFARNVSGGAGVFNQALVDSFGFSDAKAEKLKKTLGRVLVRDDYSGLKPQEEKLARSLSGAAGQVYSMIQSSLMFCKAQIKVTDIELDKLLLTGGGARLRGLSEYLADNLGVPVSLLDPAEVVDTSRLDDVANFEEKGLEYSTAVGLAMTSVFDDVYSIEVLPEAAKKKKRFYNRTVFAYLAAAMLLVYLGMNFYFSMQDHGILERAKSRVVSELRKRQSRTRNALSLQKENEDLTRDLAFLEQKVIAGTSLVRTLRLIQEHLTEDLWVDSISLDKVQDEDLGPGADKRVVVRIEGGGRERSGPLQQSFTAFTQKLRTDPCVQGIVPQVNDMAADFTFVLQISFSRFPAAESEEDEEDQEARAVDRSSARRAGREG